LKAVDFGAFLPLTGTASKTRDVTLLPPFIEFCGAVRRSVAYVLRFRISAEAVSGVCSRTVFCRLFALARRPGESKLGVHERSREAPPVHGVVLPTLGCARRLGAESSAKQQGVGRDGFRRRPSCSSSRGAVARRL
jgi:hypothetical protein